MKGNILFVEDDQDDVFVIQRACKNAGIDQPTDFSSNGKEAVQRLSEAQGQAVPSLIFLDLNMPLMGGLEFLRWLRQQARLKSIPVVVLTTSENPQDIKSAYHAGANAYLVKPSVIGDLAKMLGCTAQFWIGYNCLDRS